MSKHWVRVLDPMGFSGETLNDAVVRAVEDEGIAVEVLEGERRLIVGRAHVVGSYDPKGAEQGYNIQMSLYSERRVQELKRREREAVWVVAGARLSAIRLVPSR